MDDADSAIHPLPISKPGLVEASLVHVMPSLIAAAGDRASWRYIDFSTANIRNPNKRRTYIRACETFLAWCEQRRRTLATIRPFDVSAYVEGLTLTHSAPTVKQQLAAIRMLFDWLITGQVVPFNPASAVRGPKYVIKVRQAVGSRWKGMAETANLNRYRPRSSRSRADRHPHLLVRADWRGAENEGRGFAAERGRLAGHLHEKGGRHHIMPCHHELAEALHAYIDAAGIGEDPKGFLFRTSSGHRGIELSQVPMGQPDAWRMIRRRAAVAGIVVPIGNHSFRATGITAYLANGGVRWNMRRRWPHTRVHVRRNSMIGRRNGSRRTRIRL